MANHIIFFAPMSVHHPSEYQASVAQAMGRAIRWGQQKHVHVWHILALHTLEVGILQSRASGVLVRRENEFQMVPPDKVRPSDETGFDQPVFR